MKRILALLTCFALVCVCFGGLVGSSASAESLPIIKQWVNGAAQTSDGNYLSDEWAIDESGVSDYKYVLVGQDGTEVFRVENYPADVDGGKSVFPSLATVSFALSEAADTVESVSVTFQSAGAVYTLDFNENNQFQCSSAVYPGEYILSDMEVVDSTGSSYFLAKPLTFEVEDKDLNLSLVLQAGTDIGTDESSQSAAGNAGTEESAGDSSVDDSPMGIVKSFDKNGDLFGDTLKMFVAVLVLFGVYAFIKYRRKKKEQLNR